jgi:hypothetical protein
MGVVGTLRGSSPQHEMIQGLYSPNHVCATWSHMMNGVWSYVPSWKSKHTGYMKPYWWIEDQPPIAGYVCMSVCVYVCMYVCMYDVYIYIHITWLLTMADVAFSLELLAMPILSGLYAVTCFFHSIYPLQLVSIPNPTHFRAWLNSTTQLFWTHAATHMWVISKNDPKYGWKTIYIYICMNEWIFDTAARCVCCF